MQAQNEWNDQTRHILLHVATCHQALPAFLVCVDKLGGARGQDYINVISLYYYTTRLPLSQEQTILLQMVDLIWTSDVLIEQCSIFTQMSYSWHLCKC